MVLLGRNVGRDGDVAAGVGGEVAAMYFVVVVSVSEEVAQQEVDVGPVVMHRKLAKLVSMGSGGMEYTTSCVLPSKCGSFGCCMDILVGLTTF